MDYKEYQDYMRLTFNEWLENNSCSEAVKLNEKLNEKYFDESNPQFFAGDLDAELVLVHLNPKRNNTSDKNGVPQWGQKCNFKNYEDFEHYFTKFGYIKYTKERAEGKPLWKSKFDHKQVRFLKEFDKEILSFTGDKYKDLEIVIDHKLQLELIPFGSPDFSFKRFRNEDLKPFIDRILSLITEKERKYVIFCGRVFEELLAPYYTVDSHTEKFKLQKTNGEETDNYYSLINIKLKFNNQEIIAAIAPQFAQIGMPTSEYGQKVSEMYGKF